jgi:hypothetical protein
VALIEVASLRASASCMRSPARLRITINRLAGGVRAITGGAHDGDDLLHLGADRPDRADPRCRGRRSTPGLSPAIDVDGATEQHFVPDLFAGSRNELDYRREQGRPARHTRAGIALVRRSSGQNRMLRECPVCLDATARADQVRLVIGGCCTSPLPVTSARPLYAG